MAGLSVGLSIAALLISLASAFWSWRAHRRENARRLDELRPTLAGEIQTMNADNSDSHWYRLRVSLRTPWELAHVEVSIMNGDGLSFAPGQKGVDVSSHYPVLKASGGPLRVGEELSWRVELNGGSDSKARFRAECRDSHGHKWPVSFDADLPYDVLRSVQ